MKTFFTVLLSFASLLSLQAQGLELTSNDVRLEQTAEGGYILTVRKLPAVESVLLTESTEDPDRELASYAYRNPSFHPMNGNERRMLDGEFLNNGLHSIIDSSPEPDEEFGEAFRLFVPWVVEYGYPWTRHGEQLVTDGTYINIRTFTKPYADYSGGFVDNPFEIAVSQKPLAGPPEGNFMEDTVSEYERIAAESDGKAAKSSGKEDVVTKIGEMITGARGETLDLVIAIDTTESMEDDVPFLQENLIPLVEEATAGFNRFRLGLVYYKDYYEEYLTRTYDFQEDLSLAQRVVDTIRVFGGRDIPEAVNEALYTAVTAFPWEADERLVILIGDAPPHPLPRGNVTRQMVQEAASKNAVRLNTIILPQ